ncbi:MAG TPA: TRAP transporter small permease [Thermodesulfovibrionales bacterium]|nr:TRAP transporter small permease [Thermodesulfovibrionales bacterium]
MKSESSFRSLLATLIRFTHHINEWIMRVATIAILAASCILTLSVVTRYFLKISTDWQDEASVFLLVGSLFMCGAYVQSYRGHVGIEALADILPARVNRIRKFVVDIASLVFCSFFSWKSWVMFHEAFVEGHTTSSAWAPPLWIPYGLMALGMTNLSVQLLLQVPTHLTHKKDVK